MAATFIVLIEKQQISKDKQAILLNELAFALGNGYTYQDIMGDIINAFHSNLRLSFAKYNKVIQKNLLKKGVTYYHKELRLISELPVSTHDVDSGTITSSEVEYYLEPVASYTMDELLKYFYSKGMTDEKEFSPKRMAGVIKYNIDKYGLDKVLFMIEAAARLYESDKKIFSINDFEGHNYTATGYLEQIINNCKYSGGDTYVLRKRVLFG